MRKFEYVWLDGYRPTQSLRSKVKIDDYADKASSTARSLNEKIDETLSDMGRSFI